MTDHEKVNKILEAIRFPGRDSRLWDETARVRDDPEATLNTNRIDIATTTVFWFALYESTEGGLLWGLGLPGDDDDPNLPPFIWVDMLDIEVRVWMNGLLPEGH